MQDERSVGVVGDASADVAATLDDSGFTASEGDASSVLAADPALVVAVGDAALSAVARRTPEVPILGVDAARGFRPVPREAVADAVEHALDGPVETWSLPVLGVEYGGEEVGRAVADVSLLTAEVAHISEYAVRADGDHVARFRADGVVVATPAGSPGYARRVGCPVVASGTGVGAVAPIAPFATDPDHWVLPLDDVRLTVERDETAVTLVADEREVATVAKGEPVRVAPVGSAAVAVVPESRPRFS